MPSIVARWAVFMQLEKYFEPFLEYCRKMGLKEHTVKEQRRFLYGSISHCSLKNKKIKDIYLTDVAEIIEAGRQHGEYGSQRSVSVFRQLMKYLKDSGEKIQFDWRDIVLPKVPEKEQDFLTQQEFDDFVNQLPDTFYGIRDRTLYEALFSTGARIGEILTLNRNDIKNNEAKIKTLKSGNEDMIYFSERSLAYLDKYLKERFDNHPALFVIYNQGVRRLSKIQARKNLLRYRRKLGIMKNITHHAFRRSFCSKLLDEGATIKEVQYLARHKSERTTLKFYCKVNKRKVKETHQRVFNR